MADDKDKTTVETSESADQPEAKKKGPSKLLLLGGGGIAVVILGITLAIFVLKPMMSGGGEPSSSKAGTHEAADESRRKPAKESHGKSGGGHGGEGTSVVYAIKDIVVNPAGTGGSRFLSVSFGFELPYQGLEQDMESREAAVRDALITIMSSKTVAQLTDSKQKEITRYQIKKRVEQILSVDDIGSVYYTDFVLQ